MSAMFVDALSAEPYVKAGKLKLIAATGLSCSSAYPDYLTLNESGVPGFNGNTWPDCTGRRAPGRSWRSCGAARRVRGTLARKRLLSR